VWELALIYPLQGDWTEDDYLSLQSNQLIELSGGCLEVLPMPTWDHQLIVKFLLLALDGFVTSRRLGTVLSAPLPVWLWQGKFREPDIIFCRPGRPRVRRQPRGADLVMEVVSEGDENRERDYKVKRRDYAKAGIGEYWIIDPRDEQITVLTLRGTKYVRHGAFKVGKLASSKLLSGFSVEVDHVLAAGSK
jgi:Uma2 family endonuclease